MHNYSNMRDKQMVIDKKYMQNFTLFQNFAGSCLQNDSFFLISRIRASHRKNIPFSRKWVRAWYTFWSGVGGPGSKLNIIDSDNDLALNRRHAIIRSNAGMLLIWPLETNFNKMLIEIYIFSFKKMYSKIPSAKWRPFCVGLNYTRRYNWLQ